MKIKEIPKENRPRERFLKFGPESLSDAELMAIILRTGTLQENVIDMSNRLISEYGLDKLFDCSLKELQKIKGVGPNKGMQLLAMAELGKRYNKLKLNNGANQKRITCGKDVFNLMFNKLQDKNEEHLFIILLNTKNYLICEPILITKGTLDSSIIHPREVFKQAIKNSAARMILVHNHPSGDPTPSKLDNEIFMKFCSLGEELGIKVLDQVIIGNQGFCSWIEMPKS
jgi:DNA repair protein RadC